MYASVTPTVCKGFLKEMLEHLPCQEHMNSLLLQVTLVINLL